MTASRNGARTRLRLESESNVAECHLPGHRSPAFAWDLPAGRLRSTLAPIVEVRRLLGLAEVEVREQTLRVLDADDKTVARVRFEQGWARKPSEVGARARLPAICTVLPMKGYRDAGRAVCDFLESAPGVRPADRTLFEMAVLGVGRRPGDYSPKVRVSLDPDMPAADAARSVLGALLDIMLANEGGVRDEVDTEFLHDFRVAVRRTRSLLMLFKAIFPAGVQGHFKDEFKWLGAMTGPLRDLDVHRLEMPSYRAELPPHAYRELRGLDEHLRRRHEDEHRRLMEALDSQRYRALLRSWRQFLDGPPEACGPNGSGPIVEVASERIARVHAAVFEKGSAIGPDSPGKALHALRIECKKLRYLLEFFGGLYRAGAADRLIKALKQLQDNLGAFNDCRVQQASLYRLAEEMARDGAASVSCLLAMGRLLAAMAERQRYQRERFAQCFARFGRAKNQARFRALFRPPKRGSS